MRRFVVTSSFLLLWAGLSASAAPLFLSRPIALVLEDSSAATRRTAASGVAALGGRVLHTFDDILVVEIPSGSEFRAYRLPGIREVALNGLTTGGRRGVDPSPGRAAWNAIAAAQGEVDRGGPRPERWQTDGLVPPAVSLEAVRGAHPPSVVRQEAQQLASDAPEATTNAAPLGATELNTSEFLAGAVSVNVILVESDGSIEPSSENWSSVRESEAVSRIVTGLEWVRTQEPQAAIRFVYHVFAGRTDSRARTGYEPIRRAADPTGSSGEDLWVKEVLAHFGYTVGDRFARSRAFAAATRSADGTDWAVTVFVADSLVDTDGKFLDGRFAYSWIGGPHLVMTYDNGPWGSTRMDMVLRHELLHSFYAFDEYSGSGCLCDEHRGYLDGPNANCDTCNPVAGACVMIANGDAMCQATRRQLGWADLDGDGVIDVVGEDPATFLDAMPTQICAPPIVTGLASVVAATNRNTFAGLPHPSISVNRIATIEVRADGEPWVPVDAPLGDASLPQERFGKTFPALSPGPHLLQARATDTFGNMAASPGGVSLTTYDSLSPLGASVRASRSGAAGIALTWGTCTGAWLYRVYRRSSPGGVESAIAETAGTSWADPVATGGFYAVRPVDPCGDERAD